MTVDELDVFPGIVSRPSHPGTMSSSSSNLERLIRQRRMNAVRDQLYPGRNLDGSKIVAATRSKPQQSKKRRVSTALSSSTRILTSNDTPDLQRYVCSTAHIDWGRAKSKIETSTPKRTKRKTDPLVTLQEEYKGIEGFEDAIRNIKNGRSMFLLGAAGTGKSTFLRKLCPSTTLLTATTGIAAVVLGGSTVFSKLVLPVNYRPQDSTELFSVEAYVRGFQRPFWRKKKITRARKELRKIKTIVIDEFTYLLPVMMDIIDWTLRLITGDLDKPFGDKTMVMCGDPLQLQAIRTSNDVLSTIQGQRKDVYYGFQSPCVSAFEIVRLTRVFRQKDRKFCELLRRMSCNELTPDDFKLINSRVCKDVPADAIYLGMRREEVQGINAILARRNCGTKRSYKKIFGPAGVHPARIAEIQRDCNLVERVDIGVGDRVMLTRNLGGTWVNGSFGTVSAIGDNEIVMIKDGGYDEKTIKYERYQYEEGNDKEGWIDMLPIIGGQAITIHKSQGMTLNRVHILVKDGGRNIDNALGYVAFSRATGLDGVSISGPITEQIGPNDTDLVTFALGKGQEKSGNTVTRNCSGAD